MLFCVQGKLFSIKPSAANPQKSGVISTTGKYSQTSTYKNIYRDGTNSEIRVESGTKAYAWGNFFPPVFLSLALFHKCFYIRKSPRVPGQFLHLQTSYTQRDFCVEVPNYSKSRFIFPCVFQRTCFTVSAYSYRSSAGPKRVEAAQEQAAL